MNCNHYHHNEKFSRRDFLTKTSLGLGALTLGSLISPVRAFDGIPNLNNSNLPPQLPHFPAKAKRII